jgi:2-polyprenyl-3-methyl-5-hydroxy-6-metoxy-1,4-benzoquinol methylase
MDLKDKIIHSHIDHYSNISNGYNSLYHVGNDSYQQWILSIIIKELNINSNSLVVDVGGGTGSFSKRIFDISNLKQPILCVDSSDAMLKIADDYNGVITECLDAQQFAEQSKIKSKKFDSILLKEMIHHIPRNEIQKLYSDLGDSLTEDGIILTVTRPNKVVYPLFRTAHKVWSEQQPSKDELLNYIEKATLNVVCKSVFIDISMPKEQWFHMIRSRFWSTFSHFNDNELEDGIDELKIMLADQINISFTEELLLFITKKRN